MDIKETLGHLLVKNERALNITRAYDQYCDTSRSFVPEDLVKEFKLVYQKPDFCGTCEPSLIMIPSPACYEKSRGFYSDYFQSDHDRRYVYERQYPFEGVRGAYFPLLVAKQHIDVVEMDDPSYFIELEEAKQITFMKRFFEALNNTQVRRIGLLDYFCDRTHLSYLETHVSFVSRKRPKYEFIVNKILQV